MSKNILLYLTTLLLVFSGCNSSDNEVKKNKPSGIEFHEETLKRIGKRGDNWCLTWAEDGSQIVSMSDGDWLDFFKIKGGYHNHLYRIIGGPDDFERQDIPNYPYYRRKKGSFYGYGIISVDGILYMAISKPREVTWSGPFSGVKLLKSSDNGDSWHRVDRYGNEFFLRAKDSMRNVVDDKEMFSLREYGIPHKELPGYPFSIFDFVQHGQNNKAAKDDYLYMYSPEGAHTHQLNLARVKKNNLGIRSEWEYFMSYSEGNLPQWSKNIVERGVVHEFPQKSTKGHYFGWYSWLPSVVWNEGLGLYIMVSGGTYAGYKMTDSDEDYYHRFMHTETGSLGFWYSEKPYGPWEQIYYTDYWIVDDENNRTYQPKFSPKWISEDGKKMVLIWSDAMANEEGVYHKTNYMWNQMNISIKLE